MDGSVVVDGGRFRRVECGDIDLRYVVRKRDVLFIVDDIARMVGLNPFMNDIGIRRCDRHDLLDVDPSEEFRSMAMRRGALASGVAIDDWLERSEIPSAKEFFPLWRDVWLELLELTAVSDSPRKNGPDADAGPKSPFPEESPLPACEERTGTGNQAGGDLGLGEGGNQTLAPVDRPFWMIIGVPDGSGWYPTLDLALASARRVIGKSPDAQLAVYEARAAVHVYRPGVVTKMLGEGV